MPRTRKRLSAEEQRALMTRQGALTALAQHPSWDEFEQEVARIEGQLNRVIVARVMSQDGLDPEYGAYLRGVIHGMRKVIAIPTNAESSLERFLQAQGQRLEGE